LDKSVEEFVEAFQVEYPDCKRKLAQRHAQLKKLYTIYRRKHGWEQIPEKSVKVGRNDPCPCGNGKKYKKCCLGKNV
jgi:uncharacterized protein YecA (UPF0149 family)